MKGSFRQYAEAISAHVSGAIEEYRLHAHVGDTRREAMSGAEGSPVGLESGRDVEDQIVDAIQHLADLHRSGPSTFLWIVLRRSGRQGNVAVSPAIPIGGEGASAQLSAIQHGATQAIMSVLPRLVDAWESLTFRALDSRDAALKSEREQAIALSSLVAQAEAGDDTAKWEAIQGLVAELGPMVGPVLQGVLRERGVSSGYDPATADAATVAEFLRSCSPDVRDQIVAAILAELGIEDPRQAGAE